MHPLDRQPLSQQVASRLLEEIRHGRWQSRLPGYRDLGELLGVSRTTVETALDQLTRQGVLLPPSKRRSRRIAKDFTVAETTPAARRILVVGDAPLSQVKPLAQSIVEEIFLRLHRRGHETDYISCPAILHAHPEATLDELLQKHPDCRWIFVKPLHPTIRWAVANRLSALLLGGEVRGRGELPCVAMAIAPVLADAARRLIALGHRDIVLCINDLGDYGRAAVIQAVKPVFLAAGLPFDSARHVPEATHSGSPGGFHRFLDELCGQGLPSAIVVGWLGEALAVTSYCMKRGLRIPQDLSLLIAELDDITAWHDPGFSGYSLSAISYVTHLEHWVESDGAGLPDGLTQIMPLFVPGETIAPPRRATVQRATAN